MLSSVSKSCQTFSTTLRSWLCASTLLVNCSHVSIALCILSDEGCIVVLAFTETKVPTPSNLRHPQNIQFVITCKFWPHVSPKQSVELDAGLNNKKCRKKWTNLTYKYCPQYQELIVIFWNYKCMHKHNDRFQSCIFR